MAGLCRFRGVYYARIRRQRNGKLEQKLISLRTKHKGKAKRLLEIINKQEELYRQGLISIDDIKLMESYKLESLIYDFLEYLRLKDDSPKTITLHELALRTFADYMADKDLALLSKRDYTSFMEFFRRKYPCNVTLNIRLRAVRHFLNWCVEMDKLERLPFKITQVKVEKRLPRYFTNQELEAIYKKIEEMGNDELLARVKVHVNTGMRLREFRTSYMENGFIHVYQTKGKKERTIPVDPETAFYYEYCKKYGKLSDDRISHLFKMVLKELGLDKTPDGSRRCFHCLRHTFAVRTYYQTKDIYAVCKLLGHHSVTVTEVYSEFDMKQLARDFGGDDKENLRTKTKTYDNHQIDYNHYYGQHLLKSRRF